MVLTVLLPASSTSASAQSENPTVRREAWAWIVQRGPAPPLGAATGIGEGQLPVAWSGGEEKVTFLDVVPRFDPGSRLTLTLAIDDSGNNYAAGDAELIICAVIEPWETESPMAWDRQPARECDGASQGVYQPATNDFFFDLSEFLPVLAATGWHGILVGPDPETAAPAFQVVFRSAVQGGADINYDPPTDAGVATGDHSAPPSPGQGEDAATPFETAPLPQGTSFEPNQGAPAASSGSETDAAAPATPTVPFEDVASPLTPRKRRASFVGFYAGVGALAMFLVARPLVAGAGGLVRAGTGHERTGDGNRVRRERLQ